MAWMKDEGQPVNTAALEREPQVRLDLREASVYKEEPNSHPVLNPRTPSPKAPATWRVSRKAVFHPAPEPASPAP